LHEEKAIACFSGSGMIRISVCELLSEADKASMGQFTGRIEIQRTLIRDVRQKLQSFQSLFPAPVDDPFKQERTDALAAKLLVHDHVLDKAGASAFSRGNKRLDRCHADDSFVMNRDEQQRFTRRLDDQCMKTVDLLCPVRDKVGFNGEKIGQEVAHSRNVLWLGGSDCNCHSIKQYPKSKCQIPSKHQAAKMIFSTTLGMFERMFE